MKKIILFVLILTIMASEVFGSLTFGPTYFREHYQYQSNTTRNPVYLFMDEVDGLTSGGLYYQFDPTTEPTGAEGMVYYDDTGNVLKFYNGTAWVTIAAGGSYNSLDEAYNTGSGITVDAGAVTLTTSAASDSAALAIVHGETGNFSGLTLANASAYPGIQITTTGAGADITGTSATWSASKAGVLTATGLTVGTVTIGATGDVLLFNSSDEDLTVDMATGTNTLTLGSNSTGGTTIALGDYTNITGITALTGVAADFTISTTGDATGEDLILQQAGTGDNQVQILSAGTAAEAIELNSSAGGVLIVATGAASGDIVGTAVDDISFTATDDLTLNGGSSGSIINLGTNTHGNVIHIGDNDTTADAITIGSAKDTTILNGVAVTVGSAAGAAATTIQSGTGDLALTSTDDITLTTNTAATDNITITNTQGTSASAISIQATAGGINMDAAAALDVDIAGGQVLISSKDDAASAIALTTNVGTSETIKLTNTLGESVTEGAAAIELLAAAGGVELRSTANLANAVALTSDGGTAGTILIYNDQGTSTTEKAASVQLLSDSGSIELWSGLNAADAINIMCDGSTSSGITIFNDTGTSASSIYLLTDVGGVTATASAGPIVLNATGSSAGDTTITSGDDFLATSTGKTDLTSAESTTITAPAINLVGQINLGTVSTFVDSDGTPDVTGHTYWNTNTTSFTITDFDGAGLASGQLLIVTSKGAITYDVTSSGIKGGTTDIVTAAGDVTTFIYDGTDWLVVARMDMSDDLN